MGTWPPGLKIESAWCFLKHKVTTLRTDPGKSAAREISLAMQPIAI